MPCPVRGYDPPEPGLGICLFRHGIMPIRLGRHRPRGGFSLIELVTVITVVGLMMLLVAPRLADANTRRNVRGARAAVANLYARARIQAVQTRKPATLQFTDSLAWVTVPQGAGLDTIGAVENLKAQFGVSIAATGSISIQPTGLANAATPIRVTVTKQSKSDSVVISGYGTMQ
jgi:prepilin-type N-terminal cleavage/methylation domain-containing protein